ncbi:DHH phosphoesterase, partial [Exidia glandulosa HHB12029]
LAEFLASSKARYLAALKEGTAHEWTVVMGNEAGDLDTLVSSVAYAFLASSRDRPMVALQQTLRADVRLRPENVYALEIAGLSDHDALLYLDDVPSDVQYPPPGSKFALVDHNALNSRFQTAHIQQDGVDRPEPAKVVGIIDHHEDEGAHTGEDVSPRIIQVPTGSCSSLVANHFRLASQTPIPPELATLLLSAILIDTDGLKEGGKAEDADRAAAHFLIPLAQQHPEPTDALTTDPLVSQMTKMLNEKKFDVEPLGTRDLLRRDYKEYALPRGDTQVKVGLATVPLGLARIEEPAEFWSEVDAWMAERGLDVLGVLCSFRSPKLPKKKKGDKTKAKIKSKTKTGRPAGTHRRQILTVVRDGATIGAGDLFNGLEGAEVLDLQRITLPPQENDAATDLTDERPGGSKVRAYEQRNVDASRKAIAPLFRTII